MGLLLYICLLSAGIIPCSSPESGPSIAGDTIFYNLFTEEKDREKAMEYAELYLKGADLENGDRRTASICDTLADYYENDRYLFSKAIFWKLCALDIYLRENDVRNAAITECELGKLYYRKGKYDLTLKYASSALERFGRLSDEYWILECYNLLGKVYHICRDYETSSSYFLKYSEGVEKLKDSSRIVYAYNNAAVLRDAIRDSSKSRSLILKSLEVCRSRKDTAAMSGVYLNLISILLNQGRTDEAAAYFDTLRPLLEDNIESYGNYWLRRGAFHELRKEYGEASDCYNKAVGYFSSGEFELKLRECYNHLETIYRSLGDSAKAYEAVLQRNRIDDILGMDEMYIGLFGYQNEILHQRSNARIMKARIITWAVSGLVALILLFVFMQYRKHARHMKMKELSLKNRQMLLEMKNMEQFRLDKMAEETVGKLSRLNDTVSDPEIKDKIRNVCQDIRSTRNEDQWKEISSFVPEFNSEFYTRLIRDFPDLTVNERRLCALLNLNLSSKEISDITRQSIKSINMARTRLRGKLGLTGSDMSIQEFLAKYN